MRDETGKWSTREECRTWGKQPTVERLIEIDGRVLTQELALKIGSQKLEVIARLSFKKKSDLEKEMKELSARAKE